MPNIIYYFTGTGNSLAVARNLAKELGDTDVVSIFALSAIKTADNVPIEDIKTSSISALCENKTNEVSTIPANYEKIGFIIPTYFSEPPKVVTEIISKLQLNPSQKIFIIATCGGSNGLTLKDIHDLLKPKTTHIVQTFNLPMPPNHIVGFSPFPKFIQNFYFKHEKKAVKKFARYIQNNKPTKPLKEMDREKRHKMHEKFNGRLGIKDIYSKKAEFFTTEECNRCGTCEKLCKVGNIKVAKESVSFGDNCQQCMACVQWCPNKAIAHPNIPKNRKRYHHPDIKLEDMIK